MNITSNPGIYLLRNKINGKIYIGKANNLKIRITSYKYCHKKKDHNYIINAIKKYGWNNFDVEILISFEQINSDILLKIESEYIKKYNSTNKNVGYNLLEYSNDCTGFKHSEQSKQNMRIGASKREPPPKGKDNPLYGRKLQGKRLQQVRDIVKKTLDWSGRKHTEETKKKISNIHKQRYANGYKHPMIGKKHTEEAKQKIKQAQKTRDRSVQYKKVKQIDLITKEVIKVWNSIKDAALFFTGKSHSSPIINVCRKTLNSKGKIINKTAYGFYWEYA